MRNLMSSIKLVQWCAYLTCLMCPNIVWEGIEK
uniref:Uncharacterized protein n=1 Tax=Medicago truncatula TaxID=3880 RepID=B7FHP8_MEDTR|nr:unknown [Medicago truncatula]